MIIIIEYKERKMLAKVVGDFTVEALELDDIVLDQCRDCGEWFSEDEELYGDGYCSKCAQMCADCQRYFSLRELTIIDKEYVCSECKA